MPLERPKPRYIIVSPVKDEELYVERTLLSVTSQTLKPAEWIIVDDGSLDRTAEIIRQYQSTHPFIRLTGHPNAGIRQTGSAVMRAFQYGYESIESADYDFLVKLDCDLSFAPLYFEHLLRRFIDDPRLGIASGIYMEKGGNGEWRDVEMPPYHAAGACKVLRRKCFEEIGGFLVTAGWDTVDEIRAVSLGWKTGHFPDLKMNHHKSEGSGIGWIRTGVMHGEIYYRTEGSKFFFVLKVLHRMGKRPYLIGAFALLWGYMKALWNRTPPLVTPAEAECYQTLLSKRLQTQMKALFVKG